MSDDREQRNQVFQSPTVPPGADPRVPAVSAADKVKADFGLDIPAELAPLPSSGKAYPTSSPLHGQETVEIRPMTAREEDLLTSNALLKKGTVITELIRSCLTDKRIDPVEMLTGDRNALMVAIRVTGYGPEYDAVVECNECNVKTPRAFNLSELPVRRLEIEPVAPGLNLFEFTLPYTKKVVRFKFLTGLDEQQITDTANKQKKLEIQSDSAVTTSLFYSIRSINGQEDRAKIAGFIKMMPARDSLALRTYIKDNEPGIIMRQEVTCPACGHSEEVSMPIGVTFLWPGAR